MIVVDIEVPIIGKVYDFTIDENAEIEAVCEDIVDLIMQREGYISEGQVEIFLFSADRKIPLDPHRNLSYYGIGNGDKLLLC